MNRKLCLLFAGLCLAVAVVKSESYIEVDENGDEYEVKKFNIQGRQLNEGRSQCVVTRRKRSTVVIAPEDDSNESDEGNYQHYSQPHALVFYSPAVANDDEDGDLYDEEGQDITHHNKKGSADAHSTAYGNDDLDDEEYGDGNEYENEDDYDDEEPETIEVIQVPHFPVVGHIQGQGQYVGAAAASAAAPALSSSTSGHNNGIVVVHGHEPPKVNPHTHAVFELLPVNQQSNQQGVVIGNEGQVVQISSAGFDAAGGNDDDDNLHYNEEVNPVTTTAIWSTAPDDNYDKPHPVKKAKKPMKNKNSIKKNNKNTKKKPKRNKFSNKNRINKRRPHPTKKKTMKKRPVTTRRPYRKVSRPVNKRKNTGSRKGLKKKKKVTPIKRREPESLVITSPISNDNDYDDDNGGGSSVITSPISDNSSDNRHNSNADNHESNDNNNNRNSNDNNRDIDRKRKNKNNVNIVDQGTNTFTRTMTMTQTGGSNDEGNVNCIYIRKDPPPTTPRPFWNVLGRSANGAPRASGHYGKRKRVNMRLLA